MGFCDFIMWGPSSDQKDYIQSYYSKEEKTEAVGSSNNFAGEVKVVNNGDKNKTVTIDGSIKVTVVSDKVFNDSRNYWKLMIVKSVLTCAVTAILSVSLIGLGIALGIAFPPLEFLAWIIACIGGGIFVISILSGYRVKDSINELISWTDPLKKYVERRQELSNLDFDKILAEEKYKNLISEAELEKIAKKKISNYSDDQVLKSSDLKKFLSKDEVTQRWEKNKSNYTFDQVMENSELKKCASNKDLEIFWVKELKKQKKCAKSLEEGSSRDLGVFARDFCENEFFSDEKFPENGKWLHSYLENDVMVSDFGIKIFQFESKNSQIKLNLMEKKSALTKSLLSEMKKAQASYATSPKDAWYNSPVATSRTHASVMDLGAAYNKVKRGQACAQDVELLKNQANLKAREAEQDALVSFAELFPEIVDILDSLSLDSLEI